MAELFSLKRGSKLPSPVLTLTSSAVYDLATATAVTFVYRKKGENERIEVACTIVDADAKKVQLDPDDGVVDSVGVHQCQVEVTIDGKVMCFPNENFDTFKITGTIEVTP